MIPDALRSAAAYVISPGHRRWRRLVASLHLTPDDAGAAGPPGCRDVVICGCPRSGTALAAAMMFSPPGVISVMEPWDGLRLPLAMLFGDLREEISTGVLRRGRLDIDALSAAGQVRWCRDGQQAVAISTNADPVVCVKWPTYWQLLDRMPATQFIVCLRDPAEVVTSALSTGGRLARGLEYDVPFNETLNRCLDGQSDDPVERLVELYDLSAEAFLRNRERDNVLAVRYEKWFDDGGAVTVRELSRFLGEPLQPQARINERPTQVEPLLRERVLSCSRTAAELGYA